MNSVFVACVGAAILAGTAWAAREATCLPGRQSAVLVSYERTGGFAGIRETLVVRRSGRATYAQARLSGAVAFRVSCARLRALRSALVNAQFASLARVYAPDTEVSDGFVERVTYGGRTVRVLSGAEPPPRLARVLAQLRGLVSRRS